MTEINVTELDDDLYLIDAFMHDEPEGLACYLFDTPERVLIECGPSRSLRYLLDALDHLGVDEVATLVVTHIHLDHAGGTGHFAAHFPGARIGVHSQGARHLADPGRLWASATRIYGEQGMQQLWGPMESTPEDRLLVLEDGDEIPLGKGRSIEVLYTPGHARHHIAFHETGSGAMFVGDSVGIAFPHGHFVQPVTPPPDFDPELVTEQLHRMAARHPSFLGFAHFGPDHRPQESLAQGEERVWEWVRFVEEAAAKHADDLAVRLREWVLDGYRRQGYSEDVIAIYDKNTFWPMQTTGILRWLSARR